MADLSHLIEKNRRWAERMTAIDPDFFQRLLPAQKPEYLWIGCSDSRVPANEIVGLLPGEMFVHRNVANLVVHTDLNCLTAIQFAVDVLMVRHVIVCGHYGCGGVTAAWNNLPLGLSENWLRHVQDTQAKHGDRVPKGAGDAERIDRLCELNVIEQVLNVSRTTIVGDAWRRGQSLTLHGWIYRLEDGLLRDLGVNMADHADVEANYRTALERAGRPLERGEG